MVNIYIAFGFYIFNDFAFCYAYKIKFKVNEFQSKAKFFNVEIKRVNV